MKKVCALIVILFLITGNLAFGTYTHATLKEDGDEGVKIELSETGPPMPKPIPKSIKLPAISAWYYPSESAIQIQTTSPQGALMVYIENTDETLVYQQTVSGNLPQVSLYLNLTPGTYKITICSATIVLCGILYIH